MSNYKSTLQTNNTSIQALISKAQMLPSASGETLVDNSYNENAIVERAIRQYSNSRITELRSGAFAGCATLKSINLPKVSKVGAIAFAACGKLAKASLPQMEHLDNQAFLHCTSLTELSFPKVSFIGSQAFSSCHWLSSLTITTGGEPCTLEHSDAFTDTPFAGYSEGFGGTPHIYVRESLVDTYKSAANWSYFSSYFSGIESLEDGLITFTLNNNTCHARPNMTIKEWCESKYNTLGVSFVNDTVHGLAKCEKCGDWLVLIIPTTDSGWTDEEVDMSIYNIIQDGYILSCDCFSFTLNGAKYQAKNGMTWEEWINSEYSQGHSLTMNNLGMLTCAVCGGYLCYWEDMGDTAVYASDTIIANMSYNTCACHLITFTIESTTYQAVEGMTWGEWVESGYNTIGIKIREDGYVANSNDIAIVTDEDNIWELTATDAIIADFGYLTSAWH